MMLSMQCCEYISLHLTIVPTSKASGVPFDAKFLRLFEEVYRTYSLTRAAEHLGQEQPTVSIWLGKLRRCGCAVHAHSCSHRASRRVGIIHDFRRSRIESASVPVASLDRGMPEL